MKDIIAARAKERQILGGKEKVVKKSAQAKTREELGKIEYPFNYRINNV